MAAAPHIRRMLEELNDTSPIVQPTQPLNTPLMGTNTSSASFGTTGTLVFGTGSSLNLWDANSFVEQKASTVRIEDDFHGWLLDQASALRSRNVLMLDWDNLAEELEEMAAQYRREIKKHLKHLLSHLLKFKVQPEEVSHHHSWRKTIREAREEIMDILEIVPGVFQGRRDEVLAEAFKRARYEASDDAELPLDAFPDVCPWTFDQIMQDNFYPGLTIRS